MINKIKKFLSLACFSMLAIGGLLLAPLALANVSTDALLHNNKSPAKETSKRRFSLELTSVRITKSTNGKIEEAFVSGVKHGEFTKIWRYDGKRWDISFTDTPKNGNLLYFTNFWQPHNPTTGNIQADAVAVGNTVNMNMPAVKIYVYKRSGETGNWVNTFSYSSPFEFAKATIKSIWVANDRAGKIKQGMVFGGECHREGYEEYCKPLVFSYSYKTDEWINISSRFPQDGGISSAWVATDQNGNMTSILVSANDGKSIYRAEFKQGEWECALERKKTYGHDSFLVVGTVDQLGNIKQALSFDYCRRSGSCFDHRYKEGWKLEAPSVPFDGYRNMSSIVSITKEDGSFEKIIIPGSDSSFMPAILEGNGSEGGWKLYPHMTGLPTRQAMIGEITATNSKNLEQMLAIVIPTVMKPSERELLYKKDVDNKWYLQELPL